MLAMLFCYAILLTMSCSMFGASWNELLEQYCEAVDANTYDLIKAQYQAFNGGKAPKIADECVKQIPIVKHDHIVASGIDRRGAKLVDVTSVTGARISVMTDAEAILAHVPGDSIDPRSPRHSEMRASVFEALVRMVQALDELAPFFGYETNSLEIKLFEGLRDLATQKELFDAMFAQIQRKYPEMSAEAVYAETSTWVSPYINNVPAHSTGAAVDIHLWNNKTGSFCDMGPFNKGGSLAPTFSADAVLTDEQKNNRLLFLLAATRAGLTNYGYEFWHFSLGDRYAAYWREEKQALYGAVTA
jgi:D-alanyl-D-alanine dipeptidase